jgi:hypothetical protein
MGAIATVATPCLPPPVFQPAATRCDPLRRGSDSNAGMRSLAASRFLPGDESFAIVSPRADSACACSIMVGPVRARRGRCIAPDPAIAILSRSLFPDLPSSRSRPVMARHGRLLCAPSRGCCRCARSATPACPRSLYRERAPSSSLPAASPRLHCPARASRRRCIRARAIEATTRPPCRGWTPALAARTASFRATAVQPERGEPRLPAVRFSHICTALMPLSRALPSPRHRPGRRHLAAMRGRA